MLSRKLDEKIVLKTDDGEQIELTVVRIDNNKVRIGIDANKNVAILRSEIMENDPKFVPV